MYNQQRPSTSPSNKAMPGVVPTNTTGSPPRTSPYTTSSRMTTNPYASMQQRQQSQSQPQQQVQHQQPPSQQPLISQELPPPESPMLPIPPPSKKQRANATYMQQPQRPGQVQPVTLHSSPAKRTDMRVGGSSNIIKKGEMKQITDNAIERRRAELRRLQLQNSRTVGTATVAASTAGSGGATAPDSSSSIGRRSGVSNSDLISRARNMTASLKSRHQQRINPTTAGSNARSSSTSTVPPITTVGGTTTITPSPSISNNSNTGENNPPPTTHPPSNIPTNIPNTVVDNSSSSTTPAAAAPSATPSSSSITNRSSPTQRSRIPPPTRSSGFPTSSVTIRAVPGSDVSAYGNDDDSVTAGSPMSLSLSSPPPPSSSGGGRMDFGTLLSPPSALNQQQQQQQQNRPTSARQDTLLQMRSAAVTPNPKQAPQQPQPQPPTVIPVEVPSLPRVVVNPSGTTTRSVNTDDSTPRSSIVTRMTDQRLTTNNASPPTMTNATTTTNTVTTSTTSNKTNNAVKQESSQLRLIKDLNRVTEEKQEALHKITSLEAAIADLSRAVPPISAPAVAVRDETTTTNNNNNTYSKLLHIASTQGSDAALSWAQNQTTSNNHTSQIQDDEISITESTTTATTNPIRRGRHRTTPNNNRRPRRLKSPQPSGRRNNTHHLSGKVVDPLADDDTASRAVETVEDTYSSESARYFLRKPYGGDETMDCNLAGSSSTVDGGAGSAAVEGAGDVVQWHQPVQIYLTTATVRSESSLEVIAQIHSDSSILRLYNHDSISHGTLHMDSEGNICGYDWNTVENVENKDGILGRIMYIDGNGDEGEYWLDAIYEEAVKIRETYCGNVLSAAQALMLSKVEQQKVVEMANNGGRLVDPVMDSPLRSNYPPASVLQGGGGGPPIGAVVEPPGVTVSPNRPKTLTADACVGTEADLLPSAPQPILPSTNEQPSSPPTETETKPPSTEKDMEDPASSTDALSAFLILFFSTIYSISYFFAIRLPLKILWLTTISIVIYSTFMMAWLYLADDNGAMALGAGVDYQFYPAKMRGFD